MIRLRSAYLPPEVLSQIRWPQAFVAKCAALLQQHFSVAVVDLVTTRRYNLYVDLLELLGQADPSLAPERPCAAARRWAHEGDGRHFRAWTHALVIGEPLPLLRLWLPEYLAVPLELEATNDETCRILCIP
jgi:hypothetical protein